MRQLLVLLFFLNKKMPLKHLATFPLLLQLSALPTSSAVVTINVSQRNNSVTITPTVLMDQMSSPAVKTLRYSNCRNMAVYSLVNFPSYTLYSFFLVHVQSMCHLPPVASLALGPTLSAQLLPSSCSSSSSGELILSASVWCVDDTKAPVGLFLMSISAGHPMYLSTSSPPAVLSMVPIKVSWSTQQQCYGYTATYQHRC